MKLLVFAHTPPPHHGQSYMVDLMLRRLREQHPALEVFHVNCRLSRELADVGVVRPGKILRLLGFCLQAIWAAIRHRVGVFYYIPAPAKRGALYRDWIVMALCRPFFSHLVFHWHAMGLGEWIDNEARPWERWISKHLLSDADLSVVLTTFNKSDAARLVPRKVAVVSNGIPDPCPNGLPPVAERSGSTPSALLFLAHCTREKGLFDAIEAVRLANREGRRFRLIIGGTFPDEKEGAEFQELLESADLRKLIDYRGFISGAGKEAAFREADLFIFPTYYVAESQPVNLLEAMAYGLPVITTRWRAIPEMFPEEYPGLLEPKEPGAICRLLLSNDLLEWRQRLRDHFVACYSLSAHIESLFSALQRLERPGDRP